MFHAAVAKNVGAVALGAYHWRVKSLVLLIALSLVCSAWADEVDAFLETQMRAHHIPGLALKIISQGAEKKSAAYGLANVEFNVPVSADTVFEIGSLTKQFTAACVMMLQEQGRLSLNDSITKHLRAAPAAWSNITVRHLLTHTSGLPNYTGHTGFELSRRLTQAQFIQALAALPPDFAPGEKAKYCNSGYNLLGFTIENVGVTNYWSFLAQHIFGPLGMRTATNRDPAIVVTNRADGYIWKDASMHNRDSDLTDVFSAGAIVMSINDLAKWNASLDTEKLLAGSSKTQMWTPAKLNDGSVTPYGFGWRIGEQEGRRNIGHSGSTSGFSSSIQRFPEDQLVVMLLCNSDKVNIATTLAKEIATLCFRDASILPPKNKKSRSE